MQSKRGVAIITVLLMISVLVMLVVALLISVQGTLFTSQDRYQRVAAQCAAESGISEAMAALEDNNFNSPAPMSRTYPDMSATYHLQFNTGSSPQLASESINNLNNPGTADSYRGPNTVPPYSALLIVEGQTGRVSRTLEAIVSRGGANIQLGDALLATGRISMSGNATIDGVKSFTDATPVNASVQSNSSAAGTLIQWIPNGGTALITGLAACVGPGPIDLHGYVPAQGLPAYGAPTQNFPRVDIVGTVDSKSSSPTPNLAPAGRSTLGPGESYQAGDLVVNGDLVLNGSTLYVQGNLQINGSLTGTGMVYTTGTSSLQGDANITSEIPGNVALLSHGSVTLQGFNGTTFMNDLAQQNPAVAPLWSAVKDTLGYLQSIWQSPTDLPANYLSNPSDPAFQPVMQSRRVLGTDDPGGLTYKGYDLDTLGELRNLLPTTGATAQFMAAKLDDINLVFHSHDNAVDGSGGVVSGNANIDQILQKWANGTLTANDGGVVDAALMRTPPVSDAQIAIYNSAIAGFRQLDLNHVGTSYFHGMVYTEGAFYSSNEVHLEGSLFCKGDPNQPALTVGGKTLQPGDVFLDDGSRITMVANILQGPTTLAGTLAVQTWMAR